MTQRGVDPDWIETYTGKRFVFSDPSPESIDIVDIAHALSNLCRYNGHVQKFVSIAEHSVILCEAYAWGNEDAFALLMHDASEAYLNDMPRPIKYTLPDYRALEAKLDQAIAAKFGLKYPYSEIVKLWDARYILDERAQAMSNSGNDWNLAPDLVPLGIKLHFWSPQVAKDRFLSNFHRLNNILRKGCIHG